MTLLYCYIANTVGNAHFSILTGVHTHRAKYCDLFDYAADYSGRGKSDYSLSFGRVGQVLSLSIH